MDIVELLEKKVLAGDSISFDEAMEIAGLRSPDELQKLYEAADRIRDKFNGNTVDLCSIMNAKSGKCSEDCKFCAQSSHYKTDADEYGLVSKEAALKLARENENCGVNRFSLVTSGRGVSDKEVDKVIEIYEKLRDELKIDLCASLGILSYGQLLRLKTSGISMYHHNLETSREYYGKICTTHTFDERIQTINDAKKAGFKVCSGGIIGMGETMEDRIRLAFLVNELGVQSIPVNVLNPVKGTPLENAERLSQDEILKTMAIFRFINPKAYIRLAGGRNLIDGFGEKCFKAGANATITGNYLTTSGNKIKDDIEMINSLDLEVRAND